MENEPKRIPPPNDLVEFLDMLSNESNKIPGVTVKKADLNEISLLKQALEEQDLMSKYGKKRIEDLAKKINYHGAIINKLNTKTK